MKNCKAHCRACGRHYGGDRAFDMHRCFLNEDGEPLDPQPKREADWSTRGCAHPEDVGLFPIQGVCRISFDDTMGDGIVWCETERAHDPAPPERQGRAVSPSDAGKDS